MFSIEGFRSLFVPTSVRSSRSGSGSETREVVDVQRRREENGEDKKSSNVATDDRHFQCSRYIIIFNVFLLLLEICLIP